LKRSAEFGILIASATLASSNVTFAVIPGRSDSSEFSTSITAS